MSMVALSCTGRLPSNPNCTCREFERNDRSSQPQCPTRPGIGVFPVIKHNLSIDNDELNPLAVVEWIGVSGTVDHLVRVKDGDIGAGMLSQDATVSKTNLVGVERCHFANRLFEPE